MPDFDETAALLAKARKALAAAEHEVRKVAGEARKQGARRGTVDADIRQELLRREKAATQELKQRLDDMRRAEEAFAAFSDPRKAVRQMPDSDPLLLLPVRLETRFVSVTETGLAPGRLGGIPRPQRSTKQQLLVRVYPDSCLVDAFQAQLSEAELADAKLYWGERWCAAGSRERHLAAWRQLVTGHGAGRARYLIATYVPTNLQEEPVADDGEVVLVIQTQALPAQAAQITAFWQAMWHADGDAAVQQAAFAQLVAQLGEQGASQAVAQYVPLRFADRLPAGGTRRWGGLVFQVLPADPATAVSSWSSAPVADPLPDRFVLILSRGGTRREVLGETIRYPLVVGFDPTGLTGNGPPSADGAMLEFAPETAWLADFNEAVKAGMGFRVNLDDEEARQGFDRLYVIGVSVEKDAAAGRKRLERMIAHRLYSNADIALVPQGTPTNNTEDDDAGFARRADPEQVFNAVMGDGLFAVTANDADKRDGQWLAEALGVNPALIARLLHAGGQDQAVAHAMRTALWPGTFGYFLSALLSPVLSRAAMADVRRHFIGQVVGGGRVPALRIGHQPYGILPVTAFDRLAWLGPRSEHPKRDRFLSPLLPVLQNLRTRWNGFAAAVRQADGSGDPGQALLDVLGLHPTSAEFHFRFAQSDKQLSNLFRLVSLAWIDLGEPEALKQAVMDFLADLGATPAETPQIARMMLHGAQGVLDGGVVASEPLQAGYETEHRAYIAWLAKTAQHSLADLRIQKGVPGGKIPHALLYILLRHALLLGYSDAAVAARLRSPEFTEEQALLVQREEPLPHITSKAPSTPESRWSLLFGEAPQITGRDKLPLADYLTANLRGMAESAALAEQIDALRLLARSTREEADRAFRHHIDTCSHRLDAWLLSIPNAQLAKMERKGIFLGAYGWLENIRPKRRALQAAPLKEADQKLLDPKETLPPLMVDAASGGLIHAPSMDQAVTGAILRSAYLSADSDAERSALGVNLSSERVRNALSLMDGMRTGQSLGALLGYRFERALHDRYAEAETDAFLLELRKAFPLVDGSLIDTEASAADRGKVAARNVVDGLKLMTHLRSSGNRNYPFGLSLPAASVDQARVISEEAQRLENLHDALGDVALAESVYQSVQGNFDRAAAALDAFAKGEPPPVPDVVQTPSSGIALTHRVAVHLKPSLAAAAGVTPRATAEPELNDWLTSVLPPLSSIGCRVAWDDPVTGAHENHPVTLAQLGLAPLDLVYLWQSPVPDGAFAAIASLVAEHVMIQHAARFRCDAVLTLSFSSGPAGGYSLVEAGALVRHVAALVKSARPLRPTDLVLESATTLALTQAVDGDSAALTASLTRLGTLRANVTALVIASDAALADPADRHGGALAAIDNLIAQAASLFVHAGRFGIEQTSPDRFRDMQRRFLATAIKTAQDLLTDWRARAARCDSTLGQIAAASAERQLVLVREADLELPAKLPAAGADFAALEAAVRARRTAFGALIDTLAVIPAARSSAIAGAVSALDAVLANADFSAGEVSTDTLRSEIAAAVAEIAASARALDGVASRREQAVNSNLSSAASEVDAAKRAEYVTSAAQALFGEGFLNLPRFTLTGSALTEVSQALIAAQSGETLEYAIRHAKIPLPVDEWLHGAARVRTQVQALEGAMLYGEALGVPEIALSPLQLPYRDKDSWLGLDFPDSYDIDGARLLHTAHFAAVPDASGRFKGLVIDEWTEVVPGGRRTPQTAAEDVHNQATGVAFHFDRPNAEAPQSFLLVTPATWDGAWHWDDIVGALDSTWELMRLRAVEPEHMDDPALGQMLPATYTATASRDVTISAVLSANIGVAQFMKVKP